MRVVSALAAVVACVSASTDSDPSLAECSSEEVTLLQEVRKLRNQNTLSEKRDEDEVEEEEEELADASEESDHPPPPEHQCAGTYEAEDATIHGGVEHGNTASRGHQGFTGRSFVDYLNPAGDFVEWTVESCSGGIATASFRYALGGGNRPLQVLVNGAEVESALSFPSTGGWASWSEASFTVLLSAGTNVVRLVATGSSGANMDSLIIHPPPPVEPQPTWALVLQYGDEPYTPTAEAVGALDEQVTQFAKLADDAINALPSGGDAGFDYFKFTSDLIEGCEPNADGWDTTDHLILRTPNVGGYHDEDRGLGMTTEDYSICSANAIDDCSSWSAVDPRSNFDTVSATSNTCSRWYSGHYGRLCNHAYGAWQHDMRRRCFNGGGGPAGWRTNVKIYKLTVYPPPPVEPQPTWALVLQYGDEPYTPTAEAVGALDEQVTQFAKLADDAINALPSGGDAGFDYFKFTSDLIDGCEPNADGWDTTDHLILRTPNVGGYHDEDRGLGMTTEDYSICSANAIDDCSSWSAVDPRSNFDTVSATSNTCSRWYSGHYGRLCNHAYGAWQHDMRRRCFNGGGGPAGWRTNVKIYKLTVS